MAKKKRTQSSLGEDPIDVYMKPGTKEDDEGLKEPRKARFTARVAEELLEQVRDMVWKLSGPPECLTLGAFVEEALRRELARREKRHGKATPRKGELRKGRRV